MKKLAAVLVALALLTSACALAFEGEGYPAWDGASAPENGLCARFGGEGFRLTFDPSPDYSNADDRTIQACFFAYDEPEEHYLELYLVLPEDVAAGDVLASGDGSRTEVYLYETAVDRETFYYAGGGSGSSTDGSSFEVNIEAVERSGSLVHISGRLSARLCRYDGNFPSQELIEIADGRFSFTLPLDGASASEEPAPGGEATPQPDAPSASDPPFPDQPDDSQGGFGAVPAPGAPRGSIAPAFTLPPDYAEI